MEPIQGANSEESRSRSSQHSTAGRDSAPQAPPSSFPTLEELRDLPLRLLPEETVVHLKNAGREALLALYHLWRGIDSARSGQPAAKVRKHIDVE